jgi:predicted nucleic acid-binding protein
MTDPFVADCSVAIAWIHPAQRTELSRQLLENAKNGAEVHVPAIWHLEVANALLAAVRRKLLAESHRQAGLALLNQLKLMIDHETSVMAFSTTSNLAIQNSLSVYDAAYLELALRKSLPLGTRDEPLKTAATKSGVRLL